MSKGIFAEKNEYQTLQTDVSALLKRYEGALNRLDPFGMGLAGRIISTVSILRECEEYFFQKIPLDEYIAEVFERQINFLRKIDQDMNRIGIKGVSPSDALDKDDSQKDPLHEDLFNRTWQTLKISGDPFNDYKPYLKIIEDRLKINQMDEKYFMGKKCLDVGAGRGVSVFAWHNAARKFLG